MNWLESRIDLLEFFFYKLKKDFMSIQTVWSELVFTDNTHYGKLNFCTEN